ncbi:hypothetical protein SLS58_005754 [Diplodia intermedia]|uniref:Uncharacterized protein n=1 Tax=Diplodia intermedia TaxID=856260 RepID=A0ABR3TQ07_9PEZI
MESLAVPFSKRLSPESVFIWRTLVLELVDWEITLRFVSKEVPKLADSAFGLSDEGARLSKRQWVA